MAKNKTVIENEYSNFLLRAEKLSHNSNEYTLWCKSSPSRIYANDIILLLEWFGKPISELTASELNRYFLQEKPRKSGAAYAMQNFFKFLNEKHFHSFDFNGVLGQYKKKKKEDIKSVVPLNAEQMIILKNKLLENGEKKTYLFLTLSYDYDATPDEFVHFVEGNFSYSYKNSCFNLPTRKLKIDEDLAIFCKENPDILKKWKGDTNYHYNFRKMSSLLGEPVSYQIINRTRQEHIIKCPLCPGKHLNDAKFWFLATVEGDKLNKQWIFCVDCKERGSKND